MSRGRSILSKIIENFWKSLQPRQIWGTHVGSDYNGTKYFEIPSSASSSHVRPRRWFQPPDSGDFEQDIPPEWEAWLRYRRSEPPTEEEVRTNLQKTLEIRKKALELEGKSTKLPELGKDKDATRTEAQFPIYEDLEGTPGGMISRRKSIRD